MRMYFKVLIFLSIFLSAAISGLLGIIFGLLMTKLGTVMQAVSTIGGALGSPIDGLFVTGIFAPWVNLVVCKIFY